MAGKVNDKCLLIFRGRGAATSRVSEVKDQTEAPKGYTLEKAVRPDLGLKYLSSWDIK